MNEIYFTKSSKFTKLYSVLNLSEDVKIFTITVKETHKKIKNSDIRIL